MIGYADHISDEYNIVIFYLHEKTRKIMICATLNRFLEIRKLNIHIILIDYSPFIINIDNEFIFLNI